MCLPVILSAFRAQLPKHKDKRPKTEMTNDIFEQIFTDDRLAQLFPKERTDEFFEALYGDVEEGVYDINLVYEGHDSEQNVLRFNLNLSERPGKCLACHLTQGLPEVFSRHPIINVAGIVAKVDELLGDQASCGEWSLGRTQSVSAKLYAVPLTIQLD